MTPEELRAMEQMQRAALNTGIQLPGTYPTPEQIMEMPAGDEIERLIGIKLMGWHIHSLSIAGDIEQIFYTSERKQVCSVETWRPSFYIEPAWKVVEKVRSLGWSIWIGPDAKNGPGWSIQIKPRTDNLHIPIFAETAPLAICRAALYVATSKY